MLMKLTPGVNFTNNLQQIFLLKEPESIKDTDDLTVILRF